MLEETLQKSELSQLERAGLIQFFELTFELAWKTMKDYLESEGYNINTPKQVIRQLYQIGLIADGSQWLQALEDRNLTTHTYDEATSLKVEQLVRQQYFPLLKQWAEKADKIATEPLSL